MPVDFTRRGSCAVSGMQVGPQAVCLPRLRPRQAEQTRPLHSWKRINVDIALILPNASNHIPTRYLKCDVAVRS